MTKRIIGEATPCTWNFRARVTPFLQKNADFQSIFALGTSAVTPSKNVQLSPIGSSLHAIQ